MELDAWKFFKTERCIKTYDEIMIFLFNKIYSTIPESTPYIEFKRGQKGFEKIFDVLEKIHLTIWP